MLQNQLRPGCPQKTKSEGKQVVVFPTLDRPRDNVVLNITQSESSTTLWTQKDIPTITQTNAGSQCTQKGIAKPSIRLQTPGTYGLNIQFDDDLQDVASLFRKLIYRV